MKVLTSAEWQAIPKDYRGVWVSERTDWPNWEEIKHIYMGKRTMLSNEGASGTCLLLEGEGFIITDVKPSRLTCSCCAGDAGMFRQHWNQDIGYGICRPCVDWKKSRGMTTTEEMRRNHGHEGVHYAKAQIQITAGE